MTQVRLCGLSKRFPPDRVALHEVWLTVEPGEFLTIVGASGSGKSTLLRLIAGLESPSSGEIYFNTERVTELPPQQRDVGMVFQNYALYPHLTVFENLAFPLRIRRWRRHAIAERVRQIAALLGLEAVLDRYPRELSGGQRQRVALGRALVRSPRVFLFDEPLSNVDAPLRAQMRADLLSLQRQLGITALYVTHDQLEALSLGTRVAVLSEGRLLQVAPPEELYYFPNSLTVARFIGSPPMNLLSGVVQQGQLLLRGGEAAVPLPLPLPEGSQCILGIRAELLTLGNTPESVPIGNAIVKSVEYAGHETLVALEHPAAEGSLFVRLSPPLRPPLYGETVALALRPGPLCLFDPGSGQRRYPIDAR
jgi:ABC-type sugar transport system ATPase subunit